MSDIPDHEFYLEQILRVSEPESLRDKMAMAALIGAMHVYRVGEDCFYADIIVRDCYKFADAMLAQREKKG